MRILKARRHGTVDFPDLKKMGVALKRASWFLTCRGKTMHPLRLEEHFLAEQLAERGKRIPVSGDESGCRQMTLFDFPEFEACQQDVGVKPVYRGD